MLALFSGFFQPHAGNSGDRQPLLILLSILSQPSIKRLASYKLMLVFKEFVGPTLKLDPRMYVCSGAAEKDMRLHACLRIRLSRSTLD